VRNLEGEIIPTPVRVQQEHNIKSENKHDPGLDRAKKSGDYYYFCCTKKIVLSREYTYVLITDDNP
jgi:hypothetical protein